jgi:hypothetical protein
MNKLTERWFPLVGAAIITTTSSKFIEYSEINFFAKDLFSSLLNFEGILVGFLMASKSILIAIEGKSIIKWLKDGGVYNKLLQYFMDAINWSFIAIIFSIAGIITSFSIIGIWQFFVFYGGIFVISASVLCCYRVIYLFTKILRSIN